MQELQTELATLLKLLKPAEKGAWAPVVDDIRISGGHEQAVGAALGDDLDAAADEAAPAHWRLTAGEADPTSSRRRHAVEPIRLGAGRAQAPAGSRSAWSSRR